MWAGVPSEPLCLHTQSLATAHCTVIDHKFFNFLKKYNQISMEQPKIQFLWDFFPCKREKNPPNTCPQYKFSGFFLSVQKGENFPPNRLKINFFCDKWGKSKKLFVCSLGGFPLNNFSS
eukprot:TRINITY_DN11416_c0_g2_i3.p2 TRINITY_DN11416_c0_g2~~TRINITY_DN11416_c0_g2_i3.p2  ORF type:complete len:119 (-),score=10.46 TRINITY_DN11416_c0_g2_i3:9-365(-)